jgi:predicted solute-binding protein
MFPKKTQQQDETDIIYKYKSDYHNKKYTDKSCKKLCLIASEIAKNKTNDEAFSHFIKLTCNEYNTDICDKETWDTFIKSQLVKKY